MPIQAMSIAAYNTLLPPAVSHSIISVEGANIPITAAIRIAIV